MLKRTIKNALVIFCFTLIVESVFISNLIEVNASSFAYGADIGWLQQLEDEGVSWINDTGESEDPLSH